MYSNGLLEMIPTEIKIANAQEFAKIHQSQLFACDLEQDADAWQPGWQFIIERVDLDEEGNARYTLEKGESKSGEEDVFSLDLGDIDSSWFLICLRFGIDDWTKEAIQDALQSDFYGADIQLKNLQNNEIKLLSEHIYDFLVRFPNGGIKGVKCDMTELFSLEEDFSVTKEQRDQEKADFEKAKAEAKAEESECPFF